MPRKHKCRKCRKYFENAMSKNGRNLHICPECRNKRKTIKPEDIKLKAHQIYLKNKEYHKKYYLKNKKKC